MGRETQGNVLAVPLRAEKKPRPAAFIYYSQCLPGFFFCWKGYYFFLENKKGTTQIWEYVSYEPYYEKEVIHEGDTAWFYGVFSLDLQPLYWGCNFINWQVNWHFIAFAFQQVPSLGFFPFWNLILVASPKLEAYPPTSTLPSSP